MRVNRIRHGEREWNPGQAERETAIDATTKNREERRIYETGRSEGYDAEIYVRTG